MANLLKMVRIETIHTLHRRGWSQRRIARELGIDRETVARHLLPAPPVPKPAMAPPGTDEVAGASKPAIAPPGSEPAEPVVAAAAEEGLREPGPPRPCADRPDRAGPSGRAGRLSDCEPWREVIVALLAQELTAQRIFQDLVNDHGYSGSYYSVRRFVGKLTPTQVLPVRRLECAPGQEAQLDFGSGAWILGSNGQRRRSHVFRIVLSHSRKGYSEAVLRQTTETLMRCVENAFWHFGGVPFTLVPDNLKAAVLHADWFDPELNPQFASFCAHYGVTCLPTRPRRPEHKGKVERGVGYVKDNALKGRVFHSLEEENDFLRGWEAGVADQRIHGTTRRQVAEHFAAVERAALQPLPRDRFPSFQEGQRTVHRDGHIEVAKAYYSVPPEYLGRRLWVRWDGRLVRIYSLQMQPITTHVQREPGRFSTQPAHLAAEKISAVEHGASYLLARVRRLGVAVTRWAEAVVALRGVEAVRVLQGLWSLSQRYTSAELAHACAVAHAHGAYRLRILRTLLQRGERQATQQTTFSFMDEHPLIRPLAEYEQFVHDAFQHPKEDHS